MIHLLILAVHLLTTIAKLARPGGVCAVVAESLVLKHQLLISSRARRRAPNLNSFDRLLLGLGSLFVPPSRIPKLAVILKPRTLLRVHEARKKRKNRRLFSSGGHRRPGPKRPSKELIDAIVEFKRRNPRVGCPRIAQEIAHALGIDIDKDIVRRVQFRIYYNENRVHQSLSGSSPGSRRRPPVRGARASPASVLKGLERPHKPVETCRTIVSQMTNIRKVTVFGGTGFLGTDPSSPTSALTNSNVDEVLEKTCALCSGAWPSTFLTMASR